jgi:GntR family transcriptional regulator / MocR family aminotransferase
MPRRPLSALALDRSLSAPLQTQLALRLKQRIQHRELLPGEPLPSTRALAADLRVSRNTVSAAYDQLVSEGYLDPRPRSGIFISEALAGHTMQPPARPLANPARPPRLTGPVPFHPCQPDVRLFPLGLWNRLRGRALRHYGSAILHYQSRHTLGLPALQRELAFYLRDSRGVRCVPEQIAITSGSQQALYLLAQLLCRRGATTAFLEDPVYLGARSAFAAAGARLSPVPVDREGVTLPARWPTGSVFYTTPSRQFPTGATLAVARRLALLQAARSAQAWIIEDDYDSEFRYTRPPLPSLHSLDDAGRVIYVGSLSKVLFPSLRIGYVVLPPALLEQLLQLRSVMDDHGPLIDQATLAEFIAQGALYRHIRRCRREYASRLAAFLENAVDLPLEFPHTDGGMNLLGWLPPGADDLAASATLATGGWNVPSARSYALRAAQPGLLFGFTAFAPHTIRLHLRRLAPSLAAFR